MKLSEYIGEMRIVREVTPTFSSDAADFFLMLPNLNYAFPLLLGLRKVAQKVAQKVAERVAQRVAENVRMPRVRNLRESF